VLEAIELAQSPGMAVIEKLAGRPRMKWLPHLSHVTDGF